MEQCTLLQMRWDVQGLSSRRQEMSCLRNTDSCFHYCCAHSIFFCVCSQEVAAVKWVKDVEGSTASASLLAALVKSPVRVCPFALTSLSTSNVCLYGKSPARVCSHIFLSNLNVCMYKSHQLVFCSHSSFHVCIYTLWVLQT